MFTLFERLLKPTDNPERPEPPAGLVAFYLAFRPAGEGAVRCPVRRRLRRRAARHHDPGLHRPRVTLVTTSQPETLFADFWPLLLGMALVLLVLRPLALTTQNLLVQPGDRGQRVEPDPLAEPLARGAPVLGVLPERFRRPHRQPRDADRTGDPREPGRADHRRLVHPGLRHQRADPARLRRPLARAADRALVRRLSRAAARASCRACATARRRCRRRARC